MKNDNDVSSSSGGSQCEQVITDLAELIGDMIGFHELSRLLPVSDKETGNKEVDAYALMLYTQNRHLEGFLSLLGALSDHSPKKWVASVELSAIRDALWVAIRAHRLFPSFDMGEKLDMYAKHLEDEAAQRRAEAEKGVQVKRSYAHTDLPGNGSTDMPPRPPRRKEATRAAQRSLVFQAPSLVPTA